jgi:ABC-2 type transport system ATP-binding protein
MVQMEEMVLRMSDVTKQYPAFTLDRVSLDIPRGYIMGFVGRNGAGKSTTIKCMTDIIRADSGEMEWFGQTGSRMPLEMKERIGYVSEEPAFYEDMTVEWTGKFVGGFYRKWDEALFRKLLKRFQVDPRKKIKELSRGMKVKLSLALAMAHHPELLILDEPTSGLDPVIRSELLDVFREIIQDERASIFFSSHITSDIEKVADYITVIHNGRIAASGDKLTVLDQWKLVKADNRYLDPRLERLLAGLKHGEFGFSGMTRDIREFEREWKRSFPAADYKVEKMTLDEMLVRMAGEEEEFMEQHG